MRKELPLKGKHVSSSMANICRKTICQLDLRPKLLCYGVFVRPLEALITHIIVYINIPYISPDKMQKA